MFASTSCDINAQARRRRHPSSHESKWRMFGLRPSLCKFGAPLKKEGFMTGFFLIWTYLLASFLPYIDLSSFCRLAFNNDLLGEAFVWPPANDILRRGYFFQRPFWTVAGTNRTSSPLYLSSTQKTTKKCMFFATTQSLLIWFLNGEKQAQM